jgi:parvulin-like peptidyl-prolyl isomerase
MNNFKKDDLLMIINKYQNYTNQFINISDEDIDKLYFEIAKDDNYEDELLQQTKVLNNMFDVFSNAMINKIKE